MRTGHVSTGKPAGVWGRGNVCAGERKTGTVISRGKRNQINAADGATCCHGSGRP